MNKFGVFLDQGPKALSDFLMKKLKETLKKEPRGVRPMSKNPVDDPEELRLAKERGFFLFIFHKTFLNQILIGLWCLSKTISELFSTLLASET